MSTNLLELPGTRGGRRVHLQHRGLRRGQAVKPIVEQVLRKLELKITHDFQARRPAIDLLDQLDLVFEVQQRRERGPIV